MISGRDPRRALRRESVAGGQPGDLKACRRPGRSRTRAGPVNRSWQSPVNRAADAARMIGGRSARDSRRSEPELPKARARENQRAIADRPRMFRIRGSAIARLTMEARTPTGRPAFPPASSNIGAGRRPPTTNKVPPATWRPSLRLTPVTAVPLLIDITGSLHAEMNSNTRPRCAVPGKSPRFSAVTAPRP